MITGINSEDRLVQQALPSTLRRCAVGKACAPFMETFQPYHMLLRTSEDKVLQNILLLPPVSGEVSV